MRIPAVHQFYAAALCTVAACSVSLPAIAGGGSGCKDKAVSMDVEGAGGGQINAAKHAGEAGKRFDTMDVNRDGKLTGAEIDASHGAESIVWARAGLTSAQKISQLDRDRDGALNRVEYADGSQRLFQELDTDGDGALTASEMGTDARMTARDD